MKEKLSKYDVNELSIKIKVLEDELNKQCSLNKFKDEWAKLEQTIIKLGEKKSSVEVVAENKLDLTNKIKIVEESNSKIERDFIDRLIKIEHKFQKIDQSIDTKVHKDEIF